MLLRMPRCQACNNLDYQGQEESEPGYNGVDLILPFSKLDRDCPFCRVVISSIESVVGKDYWNARVINPENGKEMFTTLSLYLVKDEPVRGCFIFQYDTPSGYNTNGGSPENARESYVMKFLIYSADEVNSLP